MKYLNIETKILHSPEYIGAEPTARATWLSILLWCAEQENSGQICSAKTWSDRRWQQTCGVTLTEVNAAEPLVTFRGNDAVVYFYPIDQQNVMMEKRNTARANGLHGGRGRKQEPTLVPVSDARLAPTVVSEREGKERESNGKGKEGGKEKSPPAFASSSEAHEPASDKRHQQWEDFSKDQQSRLIKAAGDEKSALEGVEIWRARKNLYNDSPVANEVALAILIGELERRRREYAAKLTLALVGGNKVKIDPEEMISGEKRFQYVEIDTVTGLPSYMDDEWLLRDPAHVQRKLADASRAVASQV